MLAAAGRIVVDSEVVVVVEVAGSFTTVVQEVKTVARSAIAGARMISFFIVCWIGSKDESTPEGPGAVSCGKFFSVR